MTKVGEFASDLLDLLYDFVKPNITTNDIDAFCSEYAAKNNCISAPLGYGNPKFPKSICTSLNEVICHGIPDQKPLKDGDILNIDVTLIHDGWYGDSSRMYFVGDFSNEKTQIKKKLCKVTYDCMMLGIETVKAGSRLSDIGYAIQSYAERQGFSVVREFCGHGVGKIFHDDPSVLHYVPPFFKGSKQDLVLEEGTCLTIEPMINIGGWKAEVCKSDKWTARTKDKSLSAQFEHTIGVEKDGCKIFTKSKKNFDYPPELKLFKI